MTYSEMTKLWDNYYVLIGENYTYLKDTGTEYYLGEVDLELNRVMEALVDNLEDDLAEGVAWLSHAERANTECVSGNNAASVGSSEAHRKVSDLDPAEVSKGLREFKELTDAVKKDLYSIKDMYNQNDLVEKQLMAVGFNCESPIVEQLGRCFDKYVDLIASVWGIEPDDLFWWVFEAEFGANGLIAKQYSSGKTLDSTTIDTFIESAIGEIYE